MLVNVALSWPGGVCEITLDIVCNIGSTATLASVGPCRGRYRTADVVRGARCTDSSTAVSYHRGVFVFWNE